MYLIAFTGGGRCKLKHAWEDEARDTNLRILLCALYKGLGPRSAKHAYVKAVWERIL